MAKSIEEIDEEFFSVEQTETEQTESEQAGADSAVPQITKGRRAIKIISDVLFYVIIVVLIVAAFVYSQSSEKGRTLFGFSYYNVLTTSMQNELPRGSLILVKTVDPSSLVIGDNITFMLSEDTIVTHKINNIYENYKDSGRLGFETKGTQNPSPDENITIADNVIGKVVWHVPALGFIMNFFSEHIIFCIFAFLAIMGISLCIRVLLTPEDKKKKDETNILKADF